MTPRVRRSFIGVMGGRKERHVFRAAWPIRIAVLAALIVWLVAGVATLTAPDWTWNSLLGVVFFVLFFAMFCAYYWSMRYVVDERGITYRSPTQRRFFRWEDILQVKTSEVPLGGYWVATRRGGFVLSMFVGHRDRLRELIVARAGLWPESV